MHTRKNEILSRFSCQNSGNCCKAGGWVYVTPADIAAMATLLQTDVLDFRQQYVVSHRGWDMIATPEHRTRCFLDENNRCQVYDARPKACRTYPDWPEIWESEATLRAEAESCPGLKKALQSVDL